MQVAPALVGGAPPGDPDYSVTGIPSRKLGIWVFLASEFLFFGALISGYLLYRTKGAEGTRPHDVFDIPFTSVSSVVLILSSLTLALGLTAVQKGDQGRLRVWLLTTAALGMVFLAGQVYEFTVFAKEGLNLRVSPASSAFFVMTGFHGAHVAVGVLWLVSLFGISLRGGLPPERAALDTELVVLYWSFVDIVWIVLFSVVYLIPQ